MAQQKDLDALLHDYRARTQIHDALMRSCRGVDRLDRDMIRSAYHPDAHDNHGSFAGPLEGFIDWVFGNHEGKVISCVHHLGNVLMRIEGSVAHVESYALAFHRREVDGQLVDMMSHGRYVDRFEDRDGEWRIAERHVVFDWDRVDPVEKQWDGPLTAMLEKGKRDRGDFSYGMLP